MRNVIEVKVNNASYYKLSQVDDSTNSISVEFIDSSNNSYCEIYYGDSYFKRVSVPNGGLVTIPEECYSDGSNMRFRYVDSEVTTGFIHITGDASLYSDIALKVVNDSICTITGAVKPEDNTYDEQLTPATRTKLGGVKVGDGLNVTADGTISVDGSGGGGETGDYLDKVNPIGEGSISMNRKIDTHVGTKSVAMGYNNEASGTYSVALGGRNTASGSDSVALGYSANAEGNYSTATGNNTSSYGESSTAMGRDTKAHGNYSTAMSYDSAVYGNYSTAMGYKTTAQGSAQTVIGRLNELDFGTVSTYSNEKTYEVGDYCVYNHVIYKCKTAISTPEEFKSAKWTSQASSGKYLFVIGNGAGSTRSNAHTVDTSGNAVYKGKVTAKGVNLNDEIEAIKTDGTFSNSVNMGRKSDSTVGEKSVALGNDTVASSKESVAIGSYSEATGEKAVAIGLNSKARFQQSLAIGTGLQTSEHRPQEVYGQYNANDDSKAVIIGCGGSSQSRKNGLTLDNNGNAEIAGDITANGVNLNNGLSDLAYSELCGGKNICGCDNGKYYYPLKVGDYITISKKNPSDSVTVNFLQLNADGTMADYWTANDGNLPRTIQIEKASVYLQFNADVSNTPLMVNIGSNALTYEPYIPSVKMLAEDLYDLEYLGWSVPSECPVQNTYANGVFTQKVGRVDLGSLSWERKHLGGQGSITDYFNSNFALAKNVDASIPFNGICSIYTTTKAQASTFLNTDFAISLYQSNLSVTNSSYTDVTAFKNAMKGTYLYYELATPITIADGQEKTEKINESLGDYGLTDKFDGQLEQGYYNLGDGDAVYSNYDVRCKNAISCSANDTITITGDNITGIRIIYYNGSTVIGNTNLDTKKVVVNAPTNTTSFKFYVDNSSTTITPNTVGKISVYVNNAIEQIKNDLTKCNPTEEINIASYTSSNYVVPSDGYVQIINQGSDSGIATINSLLTIGEGIGRFSIFVRKGTKIKISNKPTYARFYPIG